ncbi:TRF-like 2, putative isoform 1 [Hibiscus syriacus]|uniref:TRF-like 2, putative isoform 1 n=1 Tax=Hibiscus syriacus TaxID=106335 RepID=A0A6A3CF62_HIBSY|nr:TRF-like 2, putative isoform 1 [Hibiscus syriacus]
MDKEGETFSPTDDTDVSDTVLKYISQVLLEEDMEEKPCMYHDSLALQAAEKSLYEVLGESYPPRNQAPVCFDLSIESPDNCSFGTSSDHSVHSGSSSCTNYSIESRWNGDFGENYNNRSSLLQTSIPENFVFRSTVNSGSQSSACSQNGSANNGNGPVGSSLSEALVLNYFSQNELALHFKRGFDEASKFLPKGNQLTFDFKSNALTSELKQKGLNTVVKVENDRKEYSPLGESPSCNADETLRNKPSKMLQPNEQANGSSGAKARGKKMIRKTFFGCCDGSQRLAQYFVDALEARLAGTGTQIYTSLVLKEHQPLICLKAYQVYFSICPFVKVAIIFANNNILKVAEKATTLHIIDFGIFYGFQWPALIHRLANRPGGPPKLRITGIEFPQRGFRPAEQSRRQGIACKVL